MSNNRGRGLQANALGTFDTVVMAVAGQRPAYSLAATTAVLVGAVGLASPAALLYCAIPMLGHRAGVQLSRPYRRERGGELLLVGRTLTPFSASSALGLVVSATIFMVAGSLPAGSMTLSLFDKASRQHGRCRRWSAPPGS